MDTQTAATTTTGTSQTRKIIVSYEEPPTICKCSDPCIYVHLTGDPSNPCAVAYANCSFECNEREPAQRTDHNPPIYQAANFKNRTGRIVTNFRRFIGKLALLNNLEVDWSGANVPLERIAATA
jgi:hypothetical protein